jgi:hypothetical protein
VVFTLNSKGCCIRNLGVDLHLDSILYFSWLFSLYLFIFAHTFFFLQEWQKAQNDQVRSWLSIKVVYNNKKNNNKMREFLVSCSSKKINCDWLHTHTHTHTHKTFSLCVCLNGSLSATPPKGYSHPPHVDVPDLFYLFIYLYLLFLFFLFSLSFSLFFLFSVFILTQYLCDLLLQQ